MPDSHYPDPGAATASNPLLNQGLPIPFDQLRAEHIRPAIATLLERAGAGIAAIETQKGPHDYASTLHALEETTEPLERAITIISHIESVAMTPEWREAYNDVQPQVSAFLSSIPLREPMWQALSEYAGTDEAKRLTGSRARFLMKLQDSFRREGAELDAPGKARLAELTVALTKTTTRFSQNVLDATNAFELVVDDEGKLRGLPASAIEAARHSAQQKRLAGYRFTLQAPSYLAVMMHLEDASIRERLYRAYNTRSTQGATDNRPLITEILRLRREKALLLGKDHFADWVLSDRMARDADTARAFVTDLHERTRAAFEKENQALLAFRRSLEGADAPPLAPWDVAFYAEKQRKALFDFDDEVLRPYFALPQVLDGMFELVRRLYGIRVEPAVLPVWASDVRPYSVRDEAGNLMGFFYADLFPRESKRDGAWMNGLVTGELQENGFSPHVGLICANLTPPVNGKPALLTHREVETLFHEFGHLLHHLLSRVEVRSLAGTNVPWDFVELPSQIMENFCWERASLDLFARHFETGAEVPQALFDKLLRSRTYRAANAMMRQLGFAAMDLALHTDYTPERQGDVLAYARQLAQAFAPYELTEDHAMIAGFGHLFSHPVGYAAGYYSYKWAEVLDADAFSRFKQAGVFSADVGRAFRDTILAKGDSAEPIDLYKQFMGREPTLEPLLERSGIPTVTT